MTRFICLRSRWRLPAPRPRSRTIRIARSGSSFPGRPARRRI
jgi:hypothetical protein